MLHLYNTLTKKKEVFQALAGRRRLLGGRGARFGLVTMYNCGPTVYDHVHIGNLRYFTVVDVLRRYLEWKGFTVKQVMNITDVGHMTTDVDVGEDKIEEAARKERTSPAQIAERYTRAFFDDINSLGIKPAWKYPKATEHVRDMVKLIGKLLDRGIAYVAKGTVYYDLSKFPRYGRLSGNTVQDLVAGTRVEVLPEKRNPYDFALWISNPKHLMRWNSPWGSGFPGWHIECSAMAIRYLGPTIDIHTGGEDNIFPHHECEIAQSEAATGRRFVRYWLHVRHLLVNGQKMSKSLGNIYRLVGVVAKGFSPRALRYVLLGTHYRDPLNFTWDGIRAASSALRRLDGFWTALVKEEEKGKKAKGLAAAGKITKSLRRLVQETREEFERAMDDDLNTSKALGTMHTFVTKAGPMLRAVSAADRAMARRLMTEIGSALGLGFAARKPPRVPKEVRKMVRDREAARRAKDFDRADELRAKIEEAGFLLEDTPVGPRVRMK